MGWLDKLLGRDKERRAGPPRFHDDGRERPQEAGMAEETGLAPKGHDHAPGETARRAALARGGPGPPLPSSPRSAVRRAL
jgi:hypothetical protein